MTPISWGQQYFPHMQVGPAGRSVPYDPSLYKPQTGIGPYAYGSGLPQPHGAIWNPAPARPPAAPTGITYHTYTPGNAKDPNPWKLPPGTRLAWEPHKGYHAVPSGAAGVTKQPAAPTDPWTDIYTKIMGSYETPAEQEARVNAEVDRQIAAQQKLLDNEYARQVADANAQAAAMNAAGLAAAGMSKDLLGLVGGEYNAGAQEIAGLSHGLSGGIAAGTAADVKGDNKGLARVGAPALTEGGQAGYGGKTQMGVEDYRGGTLGSQLLTGEGQAESFGLAGMTAAQTLQANQTAQAGLMTAMHDIRANQAKAVDALAAGRADLYHTYMADAQDSQLKALTFAQGILASQQAGTIKPITKMVGGNLMQWDPVTKTWKKAVAGNAAATAAAKVKAAAAKAALPNPSLSRIYGHVVDSLGHPILKNGQIQPVAKTATTQNVDLQLSRALHKWVDGNGHVIPALNAPGQPKPPPLYKPTTGKKGGGPTTSELNTGAGYIHEHQLLLRAQQKLDAYNKKQIAAGAQRNGKPWSVNNQITIDQVGSLTPNWLQDMGITVAEARATEDPHTLQEVYIDIVHAIGDARRAWVMMRKVWPNFGQGYFT